MTISCDHETCLVITRHVLWSKDMSCDHARCVLITGHKSCERSSKERATERSSERYSKRAIERAIQRAFDRAIERANHRASDRAIKRPTKGNSKARAPEVCLICWLVHSVRCFRTKTSGHSRCSIIARVWIPTWKKQFVSLICFKSNFSTFKNSKCFILFNSSFEALD